jgi:paraquat-inducible protein A
MRVAEGQKIECPRCGYVLAKYKKNSAARSLALGISGLLLYLPAIFLPLMTFKKLGMTDSGNIFETISQFYTNDYYFVAAMVFFSATIFPLLKLSLLVTVTLCIKLQNFPAILPRLFRIHGHLEDWAMMEVYLLGIMVTIIKMHHSTEIVFNTGFFCFIGLVIITIASSVTVNKSRFWDLIEAKGRPRLQPVTCKKSPSLSLPGAVTASESGLILCKDCGKLLPQIGDGNNRNCICPRCGAALHQRKPASVARTWALILTAIIFLIPANTLPIMRVDFLGIPSNSTILDGIKLFFEDGSYAIALIILTASVLIPIFKISGLIIVLLTIRFKRHNHLRQKTVMFRIIEFIGRWSMLDIFVIAILGVFVNFGFLTSIETAPAATYFCLVVVATMIAAMTFDSRIMWDLANKNKLIE